MVDATTMDIGTTITSGANMFTTMIYVVILLAVFAGVGYYIWNKRQYKYNVRLKVLKHGGFVPFDDVARQIEENGEKYWKLRKLKIRASVPPPDSMMQNTGGRFCAEGYYERQSGVIWSKDTLTRVKFEELVRKFNNENNILDRSVDGVLQPLTSQERSLQASQVEKAVLRKGKNGWELFMQILPMLMIFFFVLLMVIFWDKITQPTIEAQKTNLQILQETSAMQQQNIRLYMMLTGGKGNGTYVVQQLSEDQQTFPQAFTKPGGVQ